MTEEIRESSSADEVPGHQEILEQIEEARKRMRDQALPIAQVEKAAREARIYVQRTADELDITYETLSSIRDKPWQPGTEQHLSGLVSSAEASAGKIATGYRGIVPLQTQARSFAAAMAPTGMTVSTVAASAYFFARDHDPTLGLLPPGAQIPPIYVAEAATPEQKELDLRLATLVPHLAAKLEGAREALASHNPDRVGQASTSMRELLDQVLHHFAREPVNNKNDGRVMKAPWWTPHPTSTNGVTRAHRVRFVIQGYARKVDPETETHIQDLSKQSAALDSIQGLKHRHGSADAGAEFLARKLLGNLEAFLLTLLRLHRPELHQPQA